METHILDTKTALQRIVFTVTDPMISRFLATLFYRYVWAEAISHIIIDRIVKRQRTTVILKRVRLLRGL